MRISAINQNFNNSFGAVKIKPEQKRVEKTQAQILIDEAKNTINDITADDSFDKAFKKYNNYSKEIDEKKNEIEKQFLSDIKMYHTIVNERKTKTELLEEKENGIKVLSEQLNKITKTVNTLREELAKLEGNTQVKRLKEDEAIQDLKAKYMSNEGFSQLAGYEDEKNILYKYFISEIEKAKLGEDAKVPNAVLFFGPTGNGKTTFSKAFAQETGANRIPVHAGSMPDKFYKRIMEKVDEAKKLHTETGKFSVIFIDEIDRVADKDSSIIEELTDFIKDCYDKYHCIVFAATNHPLNLQLPITGEDSIFPYVVSVDPPNLENKQAVLKYYLSERLENSATDEDYKMFAKMLQQKEEETGKLYSNSVISEKLCLSTNNNIEISKDDIIKKIQSVEPDIDSTAVEKYNKEMDLIMTDREEE